MKIDLHLHSKHSKRPSIWLLNKLGCPESFLEPLQLYQFLKQRGMTHVTLTDHNAIDGCLEIAHMPDTFISEEVTTYFPEDRCKIHVLVWDINQKIHDEIQSIRENIYELVDYLRMNNIHHAVAHPLAAVNDRFEPKHFQKLLALFQVMELNGDLERSVNDNLTRMAACLSRQGLSEMAQKNGLEPDLSLWPKRFVAGSDDHAGIVLGTCFTRVDAAETLSEFFHGVRNGQAVNVVASGSPRVMARNIHSITFQYLKDKFNLGKIAGYDTLLRFLDKTLDPYFHQPYGLVSRIGYAFTRRRSTESSAPSADQPFSLSGFLQQEGRKLVKEDPKLGRMIEADGNDVDEDGNVWFEFVNRVSNRALKHLALNTFSSLRKGMIFDIFHSLGNAGSLYLALAPYFIAYPSAAAEKAMCRRVLRDSFKDLYACMSKEARVGVFTDTFFGENGICLMLKEMLACSEKQQRYLKIVTCSADQKTIDNVRVFDPIGDYQFEEAPDCRVFLPPLLEMLDYAYAKNFSHIHAATPGPTGLAALAIGKFLKRPVSSSYSLPLARLAGEVTADLAMEELSWRYLIWFYSQCDVVHTHTVAAAVELVEHGLDPARIVTVAEGVDIACFKPQAEKQTQKDGLNFIYAGRVSKAKNLHVLLDAFKQVAATNEDATLTIVGQGPYLEQMKNDSDGLNVRFMGAVDRKELPELFAQHGGVFVHPGLTDTAASAVLEAQACGMAVVVSDRLKEVVEDGQAGIVADCRQAQSLADVLMQLGQDRALRSRLAARAVELCRARELHAMFKQQWMMLFEQERACKPVATLASIQELFGASAVSEAATVY